MQIELSGTWDKLRERGYRGPFFMIHNTGGCADLFKTTASRTYNGGPIAGLIGARDIARQLGAHNVVTADVGGTSFDIGLVVGDSVRNYEFNPIIDQWMVSTTMLQSLSIGAGGGSIAWINRALGDRLEVGPQSAGSFPGPVAYQLGGTEPTVTDANLVLGYLSPDQFFGGRMALDRDAAEDAIRERIAEPLGMEVVEAAALIRRIIDDKMASAIRKEVTLRGYRPSEFTLFAFGGGGPTHVAGYMGEIPRAVMFPFSPVFCAYGSSIMDVVHLYERSQRMMLLAPLTGAPTVDREAFNAMVKELMDEARREVESEGLNWDDATVSLELDMLYGGQIHSKRASSPLLFLESEDDARAVYERFEQEFSEAFSPLAVNVAGGVYIDTFVLRVAIPGQKLELPELELTSEEPVPVGTRQAWFGEWVDTPVYELEALKPGHAFAGPAIVQAAYTTAVIPPGQPILDRVPRTRDPGGLDAMAIPTADQKLDMIRLAEPTDDELRAVDTLAPGDYEIGFQRTNDILDEALEVFQRSSRSSMGIAGDVMIALFTRQRRPGQRGRRHVPARDHPADPDQVHPRALRREPGHRGRRHLVRQRRALRRHPQPRPGDRAADLPRRQADRVGGRGQPHDRDGRGRAGRDAGLGDHAASTRG